MPIRSDQTVSVHEDKLGRVKIAREIVLGLDTYCKKNKDALTVSLSGPWGSGKSTLLDFIRDEITIQGNEDYQIIDFNPWIFQKGEPIKDAFLLHLAQSLNDQNSKIQQVSQNLIRYVRCFQWIKYFHPAAGMVQEGVESFLNEISKQDNIFAIKTDIDRQLRKNKRKILIIIDDIDRLAPSQITELIQTVTLVANFSNFVYLLAYDREIIICALNREFPDKGEEFLEKVIQVEYELPQLRDEKLFTLFQDALQGNLKPLKAKINSRRLEVAWKYHGLQRYFQNIRDIKRYESSLYFRLPAIIEEIDLLDFLCLEAIRIFDYRSYKQFYKHFRTNSTKREIPLSGLKDDQWKDLSLAAAEIIQHLAQSDSPIVIDRDINKKKLLDPAYFDRYFTLDKNETDITESELAELINRRSSTYGIIRSSVKFGRFENLLDRLTVHSIHHTYPISDYTLISTFIDYFNQNNHLLESYSDRISNMLINLLCVNKNKREPFLKTFFNSFRAPASMSSSIHIYFFHFMRLFVKEDRIFRSDHREFDAYYKKNWEYICRSYSPIFKDGFTFMRDHRQTEKAPFIKHLFQHNYAELFPDQYEEVYKAFFNETPYLLYIGQQVVKVNEERLEVIRISPLKENPIFTRDAQVFFISKLRTLEPQSLSKQDALIRETILNQFKPTQ